MEDVHSFFLFQNMYQSLPSTRDPAGNRTRTERRLPLLHHAKANGQNFNLQRMDPIDLSHQVLLGVDRLPSHGNLARFTKLLGKFFDTDSSPNDVHIAVNFSS